MVMLNSSPDSLKNMAKQMAFGLFRKTTRCKGDISDPPILKQFKFAELKVATMNFCADGLLGLGRFGSVFKGWIDEHSYAAAKPGTGMVIAVKRHSQGSARGYQKEINYLKQFSHPHIVKLIGYCSEGKHQLLVHEFMPRGSLDKHLYKVSEGSPLRSYKRHSEGSPLHFYETASEGSPLPFFETQSEGSPLPWLLRMKIALGAAKGLAFLHSAEVKVIHRNIKTSTVLLDSDYNAKLSSFEFAKDGPTCNESDISIAMLGHIGYIDPEYLRTGRLTAKSDVYGFGVVLLELLCGRSVHDRRWGPEPRLIQWAMLHLNRKHRIPVIMDPRLGDQYSTEGAHEVATLVLQCLSLESELRPTMAEVVAALEQLQDWEQLKGPIITIEAAEIVFEDSDDSF